MAASTGADAGIVWSGNPGTLFTGPVAVVNNRLNNMTSHGQAFSIGRVGGSVAGVASAWFVGSVNSGAGTSTGNLELRGQAGAGIKFIGYAGDASRFNAGDKIDGGTLFNLGLLNFQRNSLGTAVSYDGSFRPPANGTVQAFVGFSLTKGSLAGDLGWIKVKVTADGSGMPTGMTVLEWAYNDISGDPILAGQTQAVPEPGTMALALLASGAGGVLALRRARAKAKAGVETATA